MAADGVRGHTSFPLSLQVCVILPELSREVSFWRWDYVELQNRVQCGRRSTSLKTQSRENKGDGWILLVKNYNQNSKMAVRRRRSHIKAGVGGLFWSLAAQ